MVTVGAAGLVISAMLLAVLYLGESHFGDPRVANSIAFTTFALCLIVAGLECRSETASVLTTETFDSKHMKWTVLGEFVLAVLVTQMDAFQRLLGTTELNALQFGWAMVPPVLLLIVWELGKLAARGWSDRTRLW